MLPLLFPALLAACLPALPGLEAPRRLPAVQEEQEQELFLPPANSSSRSLASLEMDLDGAASKEEGSTDSPGTPAAPSREPFSSTPTSPGQQQQREQQEQQQRPQPQGQPQPAEDPHCNISVQRQMLSSLLVRWSRPLGIQCDLLLFSTNSHGRAFFSAAFHRVGPPLLIEHLGLAAGGAQQDLRLCVGVSWVRGRRVGRLRAPRPSPLPPLLSSSSSLSYAPAAEPGSTVQGEPLNFCCLDFSLEELKGEPGWRMNRKPIESTLVACFMTLVIIVWSVAALIWPVPIIAGFLPNGMEQRRGTTAGTTTAAAAK
ncbi:LOW QUALITY PROTEIN: transmembrane protein 158 [Manacus vitellinus]|uniref:LOW QUALITY PROTEIN: transmembrane protein 158 n=1 Tax=Manacus vitellinus TaxID=328815 RepID=UPI00115C738A|nr:LOW QUALITY PROTEIN: transmembrane protein 158 [Manacus vitellinus]